MCPISSVSSRQNIFCHKPVFPQEVDLMAYRLLTMAFTHDDKKKNI